MPNIRRFEPADWPAVWSIIEPVFRAGETYAYARDIGEDEARGEWIDKPRATYVATDDAGAILGSYFIKPNQPGQGAHVCNCGYIVAASARGQGVATALCEHSQDEARALGFRAMQYNLVVATNTSALRLWQRLGFVIAGTLTAAFRHPRHGYVDAHVMYKLLVSG